MKTRKKFKLTTGDLLPTLRDERTIELNGDSPKSLYIWIGGRGGRGCYGHISGAKTLECLANSILKALKKA